MQRRDSRTIPCKFAHRSMGRPRTAEPGGPQNRFPSVKINSKPRKRTNKFQEMPLHRPAQSKTSIGSQFCVKLSTNVLMMWRVVVLGHKNSKWRPCENYWFSWGILEKSAYSGLGWVRNEVPQEQRTEHYAQSENVLGSQTSLRNFALRT